MSMIFLSSPSFEGYFASASGAVALQTGNSVLKSTADKIGKFFNLFVAG